MSGEKKDNDLFSEEDGFWSLDSMLPPTEKKRPSRSVGNDVSSVEIEISGEETAERTERIPKRENAPQYAPITSRGDTADGGVSFEKWLENRRTYEKNKVLYGKKTVLEYTPNGRYVKKVTVSVETGRHAGGERFVLDGKRLLGLSGEFHGNVPFESFYPQYSQLSDQQRACYIGFRTEVQSGRFPEVSRSYIYLYLYELINISEQSPAERAGLMAALINGYRECDGKLFSDMCRWLSDLCLIHELKLPRSLSEESFSRMLMCADNRELLLDLGEAERDERAAFVLSLSRYDYRKSRFYPGLSEYYEKYLPEAVIREIEKLGSTDSRFLSVDRESCTLTRESYFGAFCIGAVRRTLTVELRCITGDEFVRRTVTDAVKYAENRLRAELMIKPRLSVIYLPIAVRDGIKAFFAEKRSELPKRREGSRVERLPETVPEYEKLYEPAESGISEEAAREIEESSWGITERLISAFDGEESAMSESTENAPTGAVEPSKDIKNDEAEAETERKTQDGLILSALKLLLSGDESGFSALVRESGYLTAAFADMINEWIYDILGDSAVCTEGDRVMLIEDYREEIKEIVNG